MLKRKSILSLTTATLLTAVTFTGCTSSDDEKKENSTNQTTNTTTNNTGNTNTTNTENTTGVVENTTLADLKGSVTGFVKDTNGNPIVGAKVFLAGLNTVTNEGGVYNFPEVPVAGVNDGNCTSCTQSLTVVITAPEGYLGGNVKVTPRNATMITHSADDKDNGTGTTISNVFADGFVAAAPDAMLPKLGASLEGVIRNNTTGEAVSGASVIVDFKGLFDKVSVDENKTLANNLAISKDYKVTTGTDGKFSITDLPEDAVLALKVKTHSIVEAADQDLNGDGNNGQTISSFDFDTHFETDVEFKNLRVVPAGDDGDKINPGIKSVDNSVGYVTDRLYKTADNNNVGATGTEHNRTVLAQEVLTSKEIVINFSEPVDTDHYNANNAQAIVIKTENSNGVMEEDKGATTELSSTQLKITLSNELSEGKMIDVNIKKLSFEDMAGNTLCGDTISISGCGNKTTGGFVRAKDSYLTVLLQTFKQLNLNAEAVAGKQMISHNDTDSSYNAYNSVVDNTNKTVTSACGTAITGVEVRQLNVDESKDRLKKLGASVKQAVVDVNTTKISFVPTNSAQYKIEVKDKNNNSTGNIENFVVGNVVNASTGATITGNVNDSKVSIKTTSAKVEFVIGNISIGDKVVITPYDDLDYEGTAYTITLADKVAPTTVIQNSYMGGAGTTDGASVVSAFGNGGELTNNYSVSATVGTPILGITPGLLDNLNGDKNILLDNDADKGDESLSGELFAHNKVNTTVTPNVKYITASNVYDSTAYKVFATKLDRNIGVAFSEDIDLTGVTPTFEGTKINTGSYTAINDIIVDDSGDKVSADLVEFTTSDVLALANDDHGKVIDFNGIKDASGNPSNNAKVVVRDMMPPFVTSAKYDGTLVVTFNEPVNITAASGYTPELNVSALESASEINTTTAGKVGLTDLSKWSLSSDKKTITVADASALSSVFRTAVSYIESDYSATEALQHSVLDFSSIRDLQGNSWDTWAKADVSSTCDNNDSQDEASEDDNRVDLATPLFALVSMIGDYKYETDNSKFLESADTTVTAQTVIWTFNQEIRTSVSSDQNATDYDLFTTTGGVAHKTITNAAGELNKWFVGTTQDGTDSNVSFTATSSITLDATNKIATFTFTTPAGKDISKIDSRFGKYFTSKVDTDQTEYVAASANK